MTVRAVDMQTMLPRLTEAGRAHSQEQQHPAVVQHAQTAQVQARAERAQSQVNEKSPVEQAAVHKDGSKGAGGGQPQPERRPRQKAGEKEAGAPEPGVGRRLDVKL